MINQVTKFYFQFQEGYQFKVDNILTDYLMVRRYYFLQLRAKKST